MSGPGTSSGLLGTSRLLWRTFSGCSKQGMPPATRTAVGKALGEGAALRGHHGVLMIEETLTAGRLPCQTSLSSASTSGRGLGAAALLIPRGLRALASRAGPSIPGGLRSYCQQAHHHNHPSLIATGSAAAAAAVAAAWAQAAAHQAMWQLSGRAAGAGGLARAAAWAHGASTRVSQSLQLQHMAELRQALAHRVQGLQSSWPLWSALEARCRSSLSWLPSLPGSRTFFLDVLSALNVAGSGGALLRTAVLLTIEVMISTRTAQAQGFAMAVPDQYITPVTETTTGYWAHAKQRFHDLVEGMTNVLRALWLVLIFTPVVLSAPLALQLNLYRAEWMELLRRTLEAGGPAFIKWGQWAATRHDLFPPDMCSELELLHTKAPAHHFRFTKSAIHHSFGMPHTELFDWFEHHPVASGSIGQIHRARLSEKGAALTGFEAGQVVAVKVRHPGVADTILRDFSTMMSLARLASMVESLSHLRLEETLSQFAAPLKEQVDLAREASNLQRFNYNFRHTPLVQFPVPLYPLVSSEVLVETYEEGDHITRYIQADGNIPINHKLSIIGSGTMLQMMLLDNLIHSDLHPGNILVRLTPPRGLLGAVYTALDKIKHSGHVTNRTRARIDVLQQRWLEPQMVLLDVGMATELTEEDQTNMIGLFRSFAAMDGKGCGEWTLRFSGDEQRCPDPGKFISDMQQVFEELKRLDEGETYDDLQFRSSADTLSHVLELVRIHKVTLPGHICAAVVTTLVLEGWSNKLDPNHSVLTQVQKMFEATTLPWKQRLLQTVDNVMEDQDGPLTIE